MIRRHERPNAPVATILAWALVLAALGYSPLALGQEPVSIGSVGPSRVGDVLTVEGRIEEIERRRSEVVVLRIRDTSGAITVPLFPSLGYDADQLDRADRVRLTGRIDIYQSRIQLQLRQSTDLVRLGGGDLTDIAKAVPLSPIPRQPPGQAVIVHGFIVEQREASLGLTQFGTITDGQAVASYVYFESNRKQTGKAMPPTGHVVLFGYRDTHEHKPQIRVAQILPDQTSLSDKGIESVLAPIPLAQVAQLPKGAVVMATGTVTEAKRTRTGGHLTGAMGDKSGSVGLFMARARQDVAGGEFSPGQRIRVVGVVDRFHRDPQIKVSYLWVLTQLESDTGTSAP